MTRSTAEALNAVLRPKIKASDAFNFMGCLLWVVGVST